jgi:F-type H+-transporting ATPase subunit b
MIDIDWTLLVQIFNFLLLVYLLNLVLFRPLRKGLKDRQALIDGYDGDIAKLGAEEQSLLSEVEGRLVDARREGLSQREALRLEGSQAEASLLDQVKKEVDAEWTQVSAKIKSDVAKAREALSAQAQEFAQALAAKLIGRELS